jgi:hypothetical protein
MKRVVYNEAKKKDNERKQKLDEVKELSKKL